MTHFIFMGSQWTSLDNGKVALWKGDILWSWNLMRSFDGMNLKQCQVDSILEQIWGGKINKYQSSITTGREHRKISIESYNFFLTAICFNSRPELMGGINIKLLITTLNIRLFRVNQVKPNWSELWQVFQGSIHYSVFLLLFSFTERRGSC